MTHLAINGFGRIGRAAFKIALERDDIEVKAINDLTETKTLAYLLKYDTVYGIYDRDVSYGEGFISVDGKEYKVFSERDPGNLPWKELEVDVVIESTGVFLTKEAAEVHVTRGGAKAVVISAPAKGEGVGTYVLGVNENLIGNDHVISNASCTTNCIAPVVDIIHGRLGVKKALMTTIHSYTADQSLVDAPHKDMRRGRAAAQNIVPTTTGAAIATTETIPDLTNKFDGISIRIPTPVVSLLDLTLLVERETTVEEINNLFKNAIKNPLYSSIVSVTDEPLVSSDFIGSPYSSIVDLSMTKVVDGDFVKIIAWYDNEWGYSNRLVEMVVHYNTVKK